MPTSLTPDDVRRFTKGDCHLLALQIHKQAGWGLRCVDLRHLIVETPCENLLDIRGLHTPEAMAKAWNCFPSDIFEPNWTQAWIRDNWGLQFGHYSYLRAYWVAKRLLHDYHAGKMAPKEYLGIIEIVHP